MMRAVLLVAAQALPSGHGAGHWRRRERCLLGAGASLEKALPPGHWRRLQGGQGVKDGDGKEGDSPVSAVLRV